MASCFLQGAGGRRRLRPIASMTRRPLLAPTRPGRSSPGPGSQGPTQLTGQAGGPIGGLVPRRAGQWAAPGGGACGRGGRGGLRSGAAKIPRGRSGPGASAAGCGAPSGLGGHYVSAGEVRGSWAGGGVRPGGHRAGRCAWHRAGRARKGGGGHFCSRDGHQLLEVTPNPPKIVAPAARFLSLEPLVLSSDLLLTCCPSCWAPAAGSPGSSELGLQPPPRR